jgi:predicted nucleic acid-binding protein
VFLVDTSIWIHALRPGGAGAVQARLRPLIIAGEVRVTEWIILELMTGLRRTDSQASVLRWFEPIDRLGGGSIEWEAVWENAARLRHRGVSVTAADCLIASVALLHDATLLHCDADFEAMKPALPLKTLDWRPLLRAA